MAPVWSLVLAFTSYVLAVLSRPLALALSLLFSAVSSRRSCLRALMVFSSLLLSFGAHALPCTRTPMFAYRSSRPGSTPTLVSLLLACWLSYAPDSGPRLVILGVASIHSVQVSLLVMVLSPLLFCFSSLRHRSCPPCPSSCGIPSFYSSPPSAIYYFSPADFGVVCSPPFTAAIFGAALVFGFGFTLLCVSSLSTLICFSLVAPDSKSWVRRIQGYSPVFISSTSGSLSFTLRTLLLVSVSPVPRLVD